MVLVDSSVWIPIEHGRYDLLEMIGEKAEVVTCPIVFTEVLRGTRGVGRYRLAYDMLMNATIVDASTPLARFEQAAQLYLDCREAGVTPSTVDCIIAATAIAHNLLLLSLDADFDEIARVIPRLRTFTRS
ncbi:MAG: type II toxin-antitoxin system VapC family toxin [Thermoanaerobaculia bacterium]